MKKTIVLAAVLCFAGLSTWAAPKNQSWTGWISDSKCGAKGANASHATCAKQCVAAGEKPVLVTDNSQKVVAIENPSAVSGEIGQHVQITGSLTAGGSLHVDKVKTQ